MTARSDIISGAHAVGWWLGGGLLRPIRRFGGAVIIAAGPWLVSVLALAIVSVTMQPVLGDAAVEDLRLTVVYAFCIAPLIAGPIGTVAARVTAAGVETGRTRDIPAIFLAAALSSALVAELLTVVIVVAFGIGPFEMAVAFVFLTGAAALLWTSFAVLSAIKAYTYLIWTFAGGMAFAVLCILTAAQWRMSTEILIWSFTAGIALSVGMASLRVRATAGGEIGDLAAAAQLLWHETARLRRLCLGVVIAIAAVWSDKWFFWISPEAIRSTAGFPHFSPYDSVMFVAHLSAIPTFAALLLFHDSGLQGAVARFRHSLDDGSSHARIRKSVESLGRTVWTNLFSILFLQATLTACMVLMAPAVAKALEFNFDQFLALRVGLVGVFFHSAFYLCCAIVLVCNRTSLFLMLQLVFLACNLLASVVFYLAVGITTYAFFASSLALAVAAFLVAYRALQNFDYLAFLGENDAFYDGRNAP